MSTQEGPITQQDEAAWTCICDHNISQHNQGKNDAVHCDECDCPDFCTDKMADEANQATYEWALLDGETWATTAHTYRGYRQGATPREMWGTCCPDDPECDHSYLDTDELARYMDTPLNVREW